MYLTSPILPLQRPLDCQRLRFSNTRLPSAKLISFTKPPASLSEAFFASFPVFKLFIPCIGFPSALILYILCFSQSFFIAHTLIELFLMDFISSGIKLRSDNSLVLRCSHSSKESCPFEMFSRIFLNSFWSGPCLRTSSNIREFSLKCVLKSWCPVTIYGLVEFLLFTSGSMKSGGSITGASWAKSPIRTMETPPNGLSAFLGFACLNLFSIM